MRRAADAGARAAVAASRCSAAVGALSLEPDAGTDQLVDNDSSAYRAPRTSRSKFGDDAVVVLVKGDLEQLVLTADLGTLLSLEGCLSGNVARAARCSPTSPRRRRARAIAEHGPGHASCSAARPSSTSPRCRPSTILEQQTQAVEQPGAGGRGRRPRGALERRASTQDGAGGRRRGGGQRGRSTQFQQQLIAARHRVRADRAAAPRRPDLRQRGRLRPGPPPGTPKSRSRSSSRAPTRR